MKTALTVILLITVVSVAQAQTNTSAKPKRSVPIHLIHKDSVNMALNENFNRIEDSCATMIRYAHIIPKERKYIGKFKDVSQLDTAVVLTEGQYTAEGLKTGLFTAYHLNGELQSRGQYDNDNYFGHWEVFYDTGKPHMTFDAQGDTVRIIDFWDASGKQLVINGKGTYTVTIKPFTWEGKLLNGRPDGTWHAYKTDDASKNALVDEYFKNGAFHDGKGPAGKYTDASHILLINPDETFPYTRAEKFLIATVPCNGVKRKHVVNAQYENGRSSFTGFLEQVMGDYLKHFNLRGASGTLVMQGVITEDGIVSNVQPVNIFDDNSGFVRGLTYQFHKVPNLNPATVDGKPVPQKFRISFSFLSGIVRWNYRFMPIEAQYLK